MSESMKSISTLLSVLLFMVLLLRLPPFHRYFTELRDIVKAIILLITIVSVLGLIDTVVSFLPTVLNPPPPVNVSTPEQLNNYILKITSWAVAIIIGLAMILRPDVLDILIAIVKKIIGED